MWCLRLSSIREFPKRNARLALTFRKAAIFLMRATFNAGSCNDCFHLREKGQWRHTTAFFFSFLLQFLLFLHWSLKNAELLMLLVSCFPYGKHKHNHVARRALRDISHPYGGACDSEQPGARRVLPPTLRSYLFSFLVTG